MLKFLVKDTNGRKYKTLKAVSMNTIYSNYKKYCFERGYRAEIRTQLSFGFLAWGNEQGHVLLLVRDNS